MADITGIIAKIKMTAHAKSKMYQEIGNLLLTDYYLIQNSFKRQRAYESEMDKLAEQQSSKNPLSIDEYMQAMNILDQKYLAHENLSAAEDMIFIRYDEDSASLFYFHMFKYNAIRNLETSFSLQTFIKNIAQYKDFSSEDFIFFSNCATDLLHSQCYKIWSVQEHHINELSLEKWNDHWNRPLKEAAQLADKYYFHIVEKYITRHKEEGYWDIDEEGLDQHLENNFIDKELISKTS